jgi:hypothetical protein
LGLHICELLLPAKCLSGGMKNDKDSIFHILCEIRCGRLKCKKSQTKIEKLSHEKVKPFITCILSCFGNYSKMV